MMLFIKLTLSIERTRNPIFPMKRMKMKMIGIDEFIFRIQVPNPFPLLLVLQSQLSSCARLLSYCNFLNCEESKFEISFLERWLYSPSPKFCSH